MSASTNEKISWNVLLESIKCSVKDTEVNKDEVCQLLAAYESQEEDWMQYVFFDEKYCTRNLVDVVNGAYNLMIMAWPPGQKMDIHGHSSSTCFIKILSGHLLEMRYETPEQGKRFKGIGQLYKKRNNVFYIEDSTAVHQLVNNSASQSISLHLFIPTLDEYQFYDRSTAAAFQVPVTFASLFGILNEEGS